MVKYLKSDEEVLKDIAQAAKDLRVEDLIPYLKAAEDWDKNNRDEFDDVHSAKHSQKTSFN